MLRGLGRGRHPILSTNPLPIYFHGRTRDRREVATWARRTVWSVRRPVKPEVAGSNPVVPARPGSQETGLGGQVAQSVERWSEKPEVDGSTPSLTTSRIINYRDSLCGHRGWPRSPSNPPRNARRTQRLPANWFQPGLSVLCPRAMGDHALSEVPRALWVCRQTVSVGECLTDENWGRSEERFVRTLQVEQRIVFE